MNPTVAIIGTRGYPSYYGGFETLVRQLVPYLVASGWNVTVYCRGQSVAGHEGEAGVRTVVTPGVDSKAFSTLSYGLTSCGHAAWQKPDVALIMNVANGYWLPALRARRVPTVVNVDGIEWERGKWGTLAKRVFRGGATKTARWADTIVCDAQQIANRWLREFGRDSVFIPYGGMPPGQLVSVDEAQPHEYVLYVARLVPENTIDEFLAAAQLLAEERDVLIVGTSGYGEEVDERVRQACNASARIHWLGHVSDDVRLHSLWAQAGVYFHGHSVGGTNPALVQAMACGAPIVARDTAYNREVLGEAGIYVDPTAAAIAAGIRSVFEDPERRSAMAASAAARQRDSYTWDDVCARYERVLRAALETSALGTAEPARPADSRPGKYISRLVGARGRLHG